MNDNSRWVVDDNSRWVVDDNSRWVVDDNSRWVVDDNSRVDPNLMDYLHLDIIDFITELVHEIGRLQGENIALKDEIICLGGVVSYASGIMLVTDTGSWSDV